MPPASVQLSRCTTRRASRITGISPTQEESVDARVETTFDEARPTGLKPTYVMGAMDSHREKGGGGVEGSVSLVWIMVEELVVRAGLLVLL